MMAIQDPIEHLVQKAKNGDREALGALIEKYRQRLTALVNSRLNAHSLRNVDVEEIVQEISLHACQSVSRFVWQGEDSFLRWHLQCYLSPCLLSRLKPK